MARTANHGIRVHFFPVRRHHGHERIEFEVQIGMAGGDQFMIHGFFGRAQMAAQALLAALHQVARIVQPEFERLFVLPSARGVRAQPRRRRAVAIFAAHAVGEIEGAGALIGRNIQRVASQTTRRRVGARQSHDLRDAHSHRIGQVHKCVRVLIAHHPGAVFVLQHRGLVARLYASVATGRTARPRSGVFRWLRALRGGKINRHQQAARPKIPKHRPFFMFLRAST